MRIDTTTTIYDACPGVSAVSFALGALRQDLAAILGEVPTQSSLPQAGQIAVTIDPRLGPEQFRLRVDEAAERLQISGGDDLGVVFGIYRDDIIRIWADNGFGAMRMRREGLGPEPHIVALPDAEERDRLHGVYYHLSFHDLQVASKLTPLIAQGLIEDELEGVFNAGRVIYLLLNVSNIRPHTMGMELVSYPTVNGWACLWRYQPAGD